METIEQLIEKYTGTDYVFDGTDEYPVDYVDKLGLRYAIEAFVQERERLARIEELKWLYRVANRDVSYGEVIYARIAELQEAGD